jgi:hypothetical protein
MQLCLSEASRDTGNNRDYPNEKKLAIVRELATITCACWRLKERQKNDTTFLDRHTDG